MADAPDTGDSALVGAMLRWFEDHAVQGLFTTDRDLRIRTWNRWMTSATSVTSDDAVGRPLFDVVPSLAERGLDAHYAAAVTGQVKVLSHTLHRYLVPCPRPDGELMPQSARIAPLITGGTVVGTITLIEDVGDRVATERRLRAQIAAADAARAEAEEASRAKDDFLATLSHEIRTPLSAVLGWVHLLKVREPDAATLKRAIAVIERNAQSQLTLISDMLDTARMAGGKVRLELTDVSLASIIAGALDSVRPTAEAKGIRIVADLPPGRAAVNGDADRLLQVVWNILSNAVKFTGEGGMVVVSLRSDRAGVHVTVADTGQGIEPQFLPQVFDRFKQADTSAARRTGGLGLGLALVKDLVTMHGGQVEVESPGVGLGSTFTIHLPNPIAGQETHGVKAARAAGPATLDGVQVLIVEDDEDAREIAARSIADAGGGTVAVSNATQALAALAARAPRLDVLVSDLGLPGTDGYSLLTAMRALPNAIGAIPAVAVTAYASPADTKRCISHGFAAHLPKPYLPSALVSAVREALDQRR